MAEAVVGERTSPPSRFFCHMCNLEINIFNNDYTCPLCSCGFIEELPPLTPGGDGTNTAGTSGSSNSSTIGSQSSADPPLVQLPGITINDFVASLLMSRNGRLGSNITDASELEISFEPDSDSSGGERSSGAPTGNRGGSMNRRNLIGGNGTGSGGGGTGAGRQRQPNFHRLDNVFLEFLSSLSSADDGVFGNSQMFFMGNPGDYAWGREGIDTVVTQLLNHMDTSGPPPLPKEKIAEIPTVAITEIEVDQKLKCSVCWEDFKLREAVRKLPCLHVYHENCIVPWLDLHGTCPICRKSLQLEPSTSCSIHNGAASTSGHSDISMPTGTVSVTVTTSQPGTSGGGASGRNIINTRSQQHQQPMDTLASSAPPIPQLPTTRASPTAAAARSSQSNNSLAFEDGNVEYDFD